MSPESQVANCSVEQWLSVSIVNVQCSMFNAQRSTFIDHPSVLSTRSSIDLCLLLSIEHWTSLNTHTHTPMLQDGFTKQSTMVSTVQPDRGTRRRVHRVRETRDRTSEEEVADEEKESQGYARNGPPNKSHRTIPSDLFVEAATYRDTINPSTIHH